MTDKELLQQALDALELVTDLTSYDDEVYEAIDAIKARLAQPEPEPVAWRSKVDEMWFTSEKRDFLHRELVKAKVEAEIEPLYTASPKKEWVGLTDYEIVGIASLNQSNDFSFARAIEAKLKDKNDLG